MPFMSAFMPLPTRAWRRWPPRLRLHSLSAKLLLTIVLWALCVLSFVSMTVSITWQLEDRGVAINQMGVLSKEVYRLVALQAQPQQVQALAQQRLTVLASWQRLQQPQATLSVVAPLGPPLQRLLAELAAPTEVSSVALMREADVLTALINQQANRIEAANTDSIQQLRIIRMGLMALILGSALLSFFLLRRLVLTPLKTLNQGIHDVTAGHLRTQLYRRGHDEFDAVFEGFNQMAANLQDMYAHLEDKVASKTEALARQKHDWAMLYQITSYLHQHDFGPEVVAQFLARTLPLMGSSRGAVFWLTPAGLRLGCAQGLNAGLLAQLQSRLGSCKVVSLRAELVLSEGADGVTLVLLPLGHRQASQGYLAVALQNGQKPAAADERLLQLLGSQLAIAKENARLASQQQQHAVLSERNLMAQKLHDSIAQSLSFLGIQFQILQKSPLLAQQLSLQANLTLIQNGIQHCYEDVRELLSNFRTRLSELSLTEAIEGVIERYQQRIGVPIETYVLSDELSLNAQQQIQVIFILQEALSNIGKHAQAQSISVLIEDDGAFKMSIVDDGLGFDRQKVAAQAEAQGHHIGLAIMQERADKIGAHIDIVSQPRCGTQIHFTIPASER
ncbi:ATP-binding protein [Neisseriaceae bacterium CLB008]